GCGPGVGAAEAGVDVEIGGELDGGGAISQGSCVVDVESKGLSGVGEAEGEIAECGGGGDGAILAAERVDGEGHGHLGRRRGRRDFVGGIEEEGKEGPIGGSDGSANDAVGGLDGVQVYVERGGIGEQGVEGSGLRGVGDGDFCVNGADLGCAGDIGDGAGRKCGGDGDSAGRAGQSGVNMKTVEGGGVVGVGGGPKIEL